MGNIIKIEQSLLEDVLNGQKTIDAAVNEIFQQVEAFNNNENTPYSNRIDMDNSYRAMMSDVFTKYQNGEISPKLIRGEINSVITAASDATKNINTRIGVGQNILGPLKKKNLSDAEVAALIDNAAVQICYNAHAYYNKNNTEPVRVYIDNRYSDIKDLLSSYRDGEITEDELKEKLYGIVKVAKEEAEYHYEVRQRASESLEFSDDDVLEYSEDDITAIITTCSQLNESITGIDISIPELMEKHASGVKAVLSDRTSIGADLYSFASEFYRALNNGEECDLGSDKGMTFEEIMSNLNKNYGNSRAIPVDEDFFKGCETDAYGRYVKEIDGAICAYDLKNHVFYVNGKPAFQVGNTVSSTQIFVPANATDCSTLNTFTFFAGTQASADGENAPKCNELITEGSDKDGYKGKKTNAILIQTDKFPGDKNSWRPCYGNTALLTKFVNQVAGTKKGCKNIIGGDSVYGAHAVKIAAQSKGLYQTVYCINNAIIVPGINGDEKEDGGNKEKTKLDDLKDLEAIAKESGMDIYFINTSGDHNLVHNKYHPNFSSDDQCKFNQSYTYTGIQILCEKCPSVNVHMMYIPYGVQENGKIATKIMQAQVYKYMVNPETNEPFANYTYEDNWYEAVNGPYNTHTDGNLAIADIVDFWLTGQNEYHPY